MAANRTADANLRTFPATQAGFIEPMECLATTKLPTGPGWVWEIKLDGYRVLAVKNASGVTLFSRRKKSLNKKFPYIVTALADLPAGTVVDGELVALDDNGRPDFNLLQNFRGGASRIYFYIFEPGKRTGAWIKHRVNRGQEFVVGGYFPGPHGIDSLIVGYYDGDRLMYVARTRNGFVPASRRQVFSKLKHLVTPTCPFVNLPDTKRSRFGEELSAEKMKKAIWLRPEAVAQIEFLEWTGADRLRHSKFIGLREDKDPRSVFKVHLGRT